jgi:2-polyprenyl-6-hydroxyphenyl methylase/3-demethylubiquinone-9 3-methyltransferase
MEHDVAHTQETPVTFSFGQNWQDYVARHLTPQREALALRSLQQFLGRENLRGLSFLDIGCGSGLFSRAALSMGAEKVVSLDVDPCSVRCTELLRERASSPAHWRVLHGSILDQEFLKQLEPADLVYAWGSLHHTGNMWQAIRNAAALVRPGGLFFISIYNKVEGRGSSQYWLKIKKLYNRSSAAGKRLLEFAYFLRYGLVPNVIRLRSPWRYIREYGQSRGMDYWVDVRDWLGGFPYEFATVDEVFRFCFEELGMELVKLKSTPTTGCNEFLFRKRN